MNPDMVGEFRVILTPVDAELGRGNGQVQIITRSGTNQFHGSGVWNIRNSALDANTWSNNKQVVRRRLDSRPADMDQSESEYTGSLGGPIIKNKTFFFALWDQQFERQRQHDETRRADGLRKKRHLPLLGRLGQRQHQSGHQHRRRAIRRSHRWIRLAIPLRPATNPNGTPYTGQLRYFSVFGPLLNTPTQTRLFGCRRPEALRGMRNRPGLDPAGISQKYLAADAARQYFRRRRWPEHGRPSVGAPRARQRATSDCVTEPATTRTTGRSTRRSITTSMPATRSPSTTAIDGSMATTSAIRQRMARRIHLPKLCGARKC